MEFRRVLFRSRQLQLLGDVPVLGALLRGSDYQNQQTELVIIVTPHLVQPAPAGSLATPADNFVPPSAADIWLFGRHGSPTSGMGPGGGRKSVVAGKSVSERVTLGCGRCNK